MSLPILAVGIAIILFFFFALQGYSKSWITIPNFKKKLFYHSLFYRLISIAGMYILTYYYDPHSLPMEFDAADAWNYHISGGMVANTLNSDGNIFNTLSNFWKSENDYGFSIYIGFVYYIFGPNIFIIKIFNCILGSITAIRVYQIGLLLYDEKKARLAGIITMIFPTLLWFNAMLLKETILIFFLINIAYYVLSITQNPKTGLKNGALLVLNIFPLYYFRLILIPIVILASIAHILFYQTKSKLTKFIIQLVSILITVSVTIIVYEFKMMDKFVSMINDSATVFNNELTNSALQRGISYKQALVAPFLLIGAVITPFPSLLHFDDNQIGIYMHFQNEIVRNIMYFFVFFGIFSFIKLKKRQSAFLLSFAIGYIIVLALSGVSFQDRFQAIALPFLILFIPEGIELYFKKTSNHWLTYLFFVGFAILLWNMFKLSIRDLI